MLIITLYPTVAKGAVSSRLGLGNQVIGLSEKPPSVEEHMSVLDRCLSTAANVLEGINIAHWSHLNLHWCCVRYTFVESCGSTCCVRIIPIEFASFLWDNALRIVRMLGDKHSTTATPCNWGKGMWVREFSRGSSCFKGVSQVEGKGVGKTEPR